MILGADGFIFHVQIPPPTLPSSPTSIHLAYHPDVFSCVLHSDKCCVPPDKISKITTKFTITILSSVLVVPLLTAFAPSD